MWKEGAQHRHQGWRRSIRLMTVIAKGWKILGPIAGLSATGSKAKIVTVAAIRMGRRRMGGSRPQGVEHRQSGGQMTVGVAE